MKDIEINVLYGFNDKYAPLAGVSVCSLLENNRDISEINIYALVDKVSPDNIEKLNKQVSLYGDNRNIYIYDSSEVIEEFKNTGVCPYRDSYTAYLRLAFEKVIDSSIEKLLYLDCDTIVVGSLRDLFNIDLGENYVGVVRECLSDVVKPVVGYSKNDIYFNSGVLLINVNQWKDNSCTSKILDMMKDTSYRNPSGGDQDYLNYISEGKQILLDLRYNFQPFHMIYSPEEYFKVFSKTGYYTKDEILNAKNNPVIIHAYRYLGRFPFDRKNRHPANKEFDKYLALSEWQTFEKYNNRISLLIRLEIVLKKVLPKIFFLRLFKLVQSEVLKHKNMNK